MKSPNRKQFPAIHILAILGSILLIIPGCGDLQRERTNNHPEPSQGEDPIETQVSHDDNDTSTEEIAANQKAKPHFIAENDGLAVIAFTWKQVDDLPFIDYSISVQNTGLGDIKLAWITYTLVFDDSTTGDSRLLIKPAYPQEEIESDSSFSQSYRTGLPRSSIRKVIKDVRLKIEEVD